MVALIKIQKGVLHVQVELGMMEIGPHRGKKKINLVTISIPIPT